MTKVRSFFRWNPMTSPMHHLPLQCSNILLQGATPNRSSCRRRRSTVAEEVAVGVAQPMAACERGAIMTIEEAEHQGVVDPGQQAPAGICQHKELELLLNWFSLCVFLIRKRGFPEFGASGPSPCSLQGTTDAIFSNFWALSWKRHTC